MEQNSTQLKWGAYQRSFRPLTGFIFLNLDIKARLNELAKSDKFPSPYGVYFFEPIICFTDLTKTLKAFPSPYGVYFFEHESGQHDAVQYYIKFPSPYGVYFFEHYLLNPMILLGYFSDLRRGFYFKKIPCLFIFILCYKTSIHAMRREYSTAPIPNAVFIPIPAY